MRYRGGWASIALICLSSAAFGQEAVHLEAVPSGAAENLGYFMPRELELSPIAPASIIKLPGNLRSPLYGIMDFHVASGKSKIAVILDAPVGQPDPPDGRPARLYIDAKGNGDLTDNPVVVELIVAQTIDFGQAALPIGTADHPFDATVRFYWFQNDPGRPNLKNKLLYYRDYARMGDITLAGKRFKAALVDELCTGNFLGDAAPPPIFAQLGSGVFLFIDANGDGKFEDDPSERYDVRKPFNIGGVTYELRHLTSDGRFDIAKSARSVPEIKPLPNLSAGQIAPPFDARLLDGKPVHFPGDYKGKIVLVDFWATWCGPCMGEAPGVVAAYQNLHSRGLEILGISFDQPDGENSLLATLQQQNMTWPQIYEGKGRGTSLGELYGIHSIPHSLLVDGDTGKIIEGEEGKLRGPALEPTLETALNAKFGPH